MSDLDYDARLADDERAQVVAYFEGPIDDHATDDDVLNGWLEVVERILEARLLDLAQRAEADRAAVERVRRVSEYWDLSEFPHEATATAMRSELIAALDPEADQ